MTFVISAGNRDQIIQISDRRLSSGKKIIDEESNKLTSIECLNARFVLGYTGIARVGNFVFQEWLLEALFKIGQETGQILEIFEELRRRLTEEFNSNKNLKVLDRKHLRLSILATGFVDLHDPPRLGCCLISNFQDFETGKDSEEPWSEFKNHYSLEKEDSSENISFIQRVGAWPAMSSEDELFIRDLLKKRRPVHEIKKKMISVVRKIADRKEAGDTVGKQLNILIIPRDSTKEGNTEYDSLVPGDTMFLGDKVTMRGKQGLSGVISDLTISIANPDPNRPAMVPKVGRNKPCPCGSGKKYKRCHGDT